MKEENILIKIQDEYIYGNESVNKKGEIIIRYPSRRELAEKYGIDQTKLERLAWKEKWASRRDKYKEIIREQRIKKEIEKKWTLKAYAEKIAINELNRVINITDRYLEQIESKPEKEIKVEELEKLVEVIEKRNEIINTIMKKVENENEDKRISKEVYKKIRYEEEKALLEIKEREQEEKELRKRKKELERRIKEKERAPIKYKWG